MNVFENIDIVSSNMKKLKWIKKKQRSEVFVTFSALLNDVDKEYVITSIYQHVEDAKYCKKNMCTGQILHFGSNRYYVRWGMNANYFTVNKSYLAEYVFK